jgi:hypothetical protein
VWQDDCPPNNSDSAHGQPTCYCWGGSIPLSGWNTASPISKNVTNIGAFRGRSVKVAPGTTATVLETFIEKAGPNAGGTFTFAAAVESGKGRVVAFGDEWITYNSQWDGSTLTQKPEVYSDSYNPCYNQQPQNVFQIPQFWYNTLKWCAPLVDCQLKIDNPTIIVN